MDRSLADAIRLDVPIDASRFKRDFGPVPDLDKKLCTDAGLLPGAEGVPALPYQPKVLWKTSLGPQKYHGPSPAADSVASYVADPSSGIVAVSHSGQPLWAWPVTPGDYIDYDPVVLGELVVVSARKGKVHALSKVDGTAVWSTPLDGPFDPDADLNAGGIAVGENSSLHVGGADGKQYTLSDSGQIINRVAIAGWPSFGSAVVDEAGNLFRSPALTPRIYSIAGGATVSWVVLFPGGPQEVGGLIPGPAGSLFASVFPLKGQDQLVSLDRACGAVRWSVSGPSGCYVTGPDGKLYCIERSTNIDRILALSHAGKVVWAAELDNSGAAGPVSYVWIGPLGADGVLYATVNHSLPSDSPPGALHAYSSSSGNLLWKYPFPGEQLKGAPVLLPDGKLIVVAVAGGATPTGSYLVAIQTASPGLARSGWPRAAHDNRNTWSAQTPLP